MTPLVELMERFVMVDFKSRNSFILGFLEA